MWLEGLTQEEWEIKHEKDGLSMAVHGKCDEWILDNYKEGDIIIVWNQFNYDLEKIELIHCYIKRGDFYIDARGKTKNQKVIEEDGDYDEDTSHYICKTLDEYKKIIRQICKYKDDCWK